MIDNEFGNDILTLEDDDGVEHTFEVLDAKPLHVSLPCL